MIRRIAAGVGVLLLLGGCAGHAIRYTWTGEGKMPLQQAHVHCVRETNKSYVPVAAGKGPLQTLYKDCMEQQGFSKVGSDEVPLEWVGNDGKVRPVDANACRAANQTCLF
jgi:hypothetical protein